MEGVTEGKSDIIPIAVNRFVTNLIIISKNTMLSTYASFLKFRFDTMVYMKKKQNFKLRVA